MFGLRDRKGLSNAVVAVLMVALSISAIGLVWVYVSNFLGDESLSPAVSCLNLQIEDVMSLQKACYNLETGDVELDVRRLGDGYRFDNIYFLIGGGDTDTKRYCCGVDCDACDVLDSGSSKNYFLGGGSGDVGKNVVLTISDCGVDEIEIEAC